jgi:hypothetical protein
MKKELQITEDLKEIVSVLNEDDAQTILLLKDELVDNWHKKQIFRTETEMRVSVLNDAKHPTNASKYWQSVREMSAHFDALMNLSFDLRKNTVDNLRLDKKMQDLLENEDENKFDIMDAQIDLDRNLYDRSCMLQVAKDRVRELSLWSTIKRELDDSSFDVENVNTHQAESLHRYFENRVKSLNDSSAPGEIINAMGPYLSFNRLKTDDGKLKNFLGEVTEDTKKKLN